MRQPPKDREPAKPKKKLDEACKELKDRFQEERRLFKSEEDRAKEQAEADELMAQLYGPNWRDTG